MDFGQHMPHASHDLRMSGNRGSRDYSAMPGESSGRVSMPIQPGSRRAMPQFDSQVMAARSPPKAKSTSHVPCKFYPQGTCQAGAACQFSHDLDATTQNAPCKYFARGSCKFGQSCALMHILPDGRVINRPPPRGGYGRRGTHNGSMYNGVPTSPVTISTQESQYPLPEGMTARYHDPSTAYTHQPSSPMFRAEIHLSNTSSPYGSPPGDFLGARSPPRSGLLTARDAPLPSSWDSQGISQAARHGPYASSVPGRIGFESPSTSFPSAQMGSTALRDMRDPMYNDTANLDGVLHGLGTPPRDDDSMSFAKRPLHSQRFARQRLPISSSLDVRTSHGFAESQSSESNDEGHSDGVGEDLLPSSLHDLLPTDRPRRSSRSGTGPTSGSEDSSPWGRRVQSNGNGSTKVGSLSPLSASPSRYTAFFGARQSSSTLGSPKDEAATLQFGTAMRPSNLRTSSTAEADQSQSKGSGMSMLTSQLRSARIDGAQGDRGATSAPSGSASTSYAARARAAASTQRAASPLSTPSRSANDLSGLGKQEESDAMFEFDDQDEGGEMVGSQIMGASQTLRGSVAEPGEVSEPVTVANGGRHGQSVTSGDRWLGTSPVGVIGGGRGK